MASPSEAWMREYNEASKLSDDINSMVSKASSLPPTGPQTQRHFSSTRRKLTILKTKLDALDSSLSKLPTQQPLSAKEMNRRKDMLTNIRSKVEQMGTTLNSFTTANRDRLFGSDSKSDEIVKRAAEMDNQGVVVFQQQIMREQDEGLEKLEETVLSTKHIALAVNEELNLQTRLLDTLDDHVDSTGSRLQRIQKGLAALNRRTKGSCYGICFVGLIIVLLILIIVALIKYL